MMCLSPEYMLYISSVYIKFHTRYIVPHDAHMIALTNARELTPAFCTASPHEGTVPLTIYCEYTPIK